MTDMTCRKSMTRCQTPGMCAPHGGCHAQGIEPSKLAAIAGNYFTELKMLAEKATPGPWWVDSHGMTMMSMKNLEVVFNHPTHGVASRNEETGNLSHWRNDWDASFIAAANPATVLALIAENEALRESDQESTELCDTLSALLSGVAVAVRGPEKPRSRHGFHDLPSRIKTVVAERDHLALCARQWEEAAMQWGAERDQLKAENERLRADYASLSTFNPDWDRVAAAQDSVREHMAAAVQLKAEDEALRKARVPAGLYRELVALRGLRDQAKAYVDGYLLDEVEDVESCVSEDQHLSASALSERLMDAFEAHWDAAISKVEQS